MVDDVPIDIARWIRNERERLSKFEQHWEKNMLHGHGLKPDEFQTEETWRCEYELWLFRTYNLG